MNTIIILGAVIIGFLIACLVLEIEKRIQSRKDIKILECHYTSDGFSGLETMSGRDFRQEVKEHFEKEGKK